MPKPKKRADGRYRKRKTINGRVVDFYGKTLAEIDAKIAEAERRAYAPAKFKEIAEEWKNAEWDKLSVTTQRGYKRAYERAVEHFGDEYADEISTADINRYLQYFIEHKYALKTVQAQKGIISIIYRHAILNDRAEKNPAVGFALPRHLPKTRREIPSDEDIQKIAHGEYEWILPRILIYTGLRRGEVLALCWEDIDKQKKTISVNKTVVFEGNRPKVENRTKTEAGTRIVPLPDALARYLPSNLHGALFDYPESTLRNKWRKWAKDLGVKCTMHQCRHAYASILLDAGIEAKDAQKVLGHSDVNVTQNIYTHILESRGQATADKINAYFGK